MNAVHPAPQERDADGGVWLTRNQVATLTGKHVDTVRRWQRDNNLSAKTDPATGEVMLSAAELVQHGRIDPLQAVQPEQTIARSRVERELAEARRELVQLEAVNQRLVDEVEFLRTMVLGHGAKRAA